MPVHYTGEIPDRNYSVEDFRLKKIILTSYIRSRTAYNKSIFFRAVFRSNGLLGTIRSTCYSDLNGRPFEYAVDVIAEWGTEHCISTECKSIREAKNILYMWFKSKGFSVPVAEIKNDWRKGYLAFNEVQLSLFNRL